MDIGQRNVRIIMHLDTLMLIFYTDTHGRDQLCCRSQNLVWVQVGRSMTAEAFASCEYGLCLWIRHERVKFSFGGTYSIGSHILPLSQN